MEETNNGMVVISRSTLDDLIWMSIRYCIGRHTISCAFHANDIKLIIDNNIGIIGKDRVRFYIKEIKENVEHFREVYNDIKNEDIDLNAWQCVATYLEEKYV